MVKKKQKTIDGAEVYENDLPSASSGNTSDGKEYVTVHTGQKKAKQPSLFKALCISFGPYYMLGGVYKLVADIISFINPQLLRYIVCNVLF